jgi:hypothetical protein
VVKGDLPLKVTWSFHGEELSSHMGISTTKIGDRTSLLTIDSVMAGHSGNYTCTAENSSGTASYSASLLVNGMAQIYQSAISLVDCLVFHRFACFVVVTSLS